MKLYLLAFLILFVPLVSCAQEALDFADQMPEFSGNFPAFLKENLKYPADAAKYNVHGTVISRFIVDTAGNVSNVSIVKSVSPSVDSEAFRLISIMPRWKPGVQDGKKTSVWTTLPINFERTFTYYETLPKPLFDLYKFIADNIRYPKEALDVGIEGKVIVKFVVDSTGAIIEPRIVQSVSEPLDDEALRLVRLMPPWQPGALNGHKVRVWYTLPINFCASGSK